jgi:magnesium-transporting ATPase (P-type)
MLLAQFADVMVLVLIGAAIIAALVGDPEDTLAIVAIVILSITVECDFNLWVRTYVITHPKIG